MHAPEDDDPLRKVIAEFRTDVDRLIADQMARLGALDELLRAAPEARPDPAITVAPRPRREPRLVAVASPAPAPPPPKAEPVMAAADVDPRHRLDALAKRLDGRARRGE